MTVWERIDKLLDEMGMEQQELAARMGIRSTRFSKFKSGEAKPKIREMWQIARELHVPLDWLLDDDAPADPPTDGLTPADRTILQAWWSVRPYVDLGTVAAAIGGAGK